MPPPQPNTLNRRRFVALSLAALTLAIALPGCGGRRRVRRRTRRRDRRQDRREDRRDWLFDDD